MHNKNKYLYKIKKFKNNLFYKKYAVVYLKHNYINNNH